MLLQMSPPGPLLPVHPRDRGAGQVLSQHSAPQLLAFPLHSFPATPGVWERWEGDLRPSLPGEFPLDWEQFPSVPVLPHASTLHRAGHQAGASHGCKDLGIKFPKGGSP